MSATSAPDIRQLQDRQLPDAKFPGDAKADFRVCIDPKAHEQVQAHAKENTGVEICGVLVGQWGRDEKGPFLSITASIRGEAATNKFAEVTFTHDTWSKINARMDKDFSGKSIVGWYHTHPDFGIFLSDRDRFIHEHFFNEPGQVALVVDPVRKQEGLFVWSAGKPAPTPYYWLGDKIFMSQASAEEELGKSKKDNKRRNVAANPDDRLPDYGATLSWITFALGALCALLIGWMLHDRIASYERQKLVEFMLVDRVRLNRDLSAALQNLQTGYFPLAVLQRSGKPLPPEVQAALNEASVGMSTASQQLAALTRQYGLDPKEIGQISAILAQKQAELEAALAPATTMPGPATSPSVAAAATQPATAPAANAK